MFQPRLFSGLVTLDDIILLKQQPIQDGMTPNVIYVHPTDSVQDVAHLMVMHRVVAPEPLVSETVSLMSQVGPRGDDLTRFRSYEPSGSATWRQIECALVMQDSQLVGILTKHDLVRLAASGRSLDGVTVAEVMTSPVITYNLAEGHDISTVLDQFQRHPIRYLPVLDQQQQLLGVITQDHAHRALAIIHLLRHRQIQDVMTPDVICVRPTNSVQDVAHLLTAHQVDCVAVCAYEDNSASLPPKSMMPLGLVTESDVLQLQLLNLDLAATPVTRAMSTPPMSLHPDDSLWIAHEYFQRHPVHHTLITDNTGALSGLLTQTHLLQAVDPADLYSTIAQLQQDSDQRKQLNQALVRSQVQCQTYETALYDVLNTIHIAITQIRVLADQTFEEQYFSASCEHIYSYTSEEFLQNPDLWRSRVLPADWENVILPCFEQIFAERPTTIEYRFLDRTDTIRWISKTLASRRDPINHCWQVITVATNITKRKLAEEALRLSEAKFASAFHASPDSMTLTRLSDGQLVEANQSFTRIYGYSAEEAIGQTTVELKMWLDPAERNKMIQTLQTVGTVRDQEYLFRTRSGDIISALFSAELIQIGEESYILAVVKDITERKHLEAALQQSEARLNDILNTNTAAIARFRIDSNSRIEAEYRSAGCERVFGYSAQEMLANSDLWRSRVLPEDLETVIRPAIQAILAQQNITVEYRFLDKDNNIRWISDTLTCQWNDATSCQIVTAVGLDITDRKLAEAALKESELRFRGIFDQMFQFIGLLSLDGILLEVNHTALEFVGLDRSDVLGRPFWDTFWWQISTETQTQLQEAIARAAQGEFVRYEVDVQGANHQIITLDFSLRPIIDDAGQVVLLIPEGRDISDRKQTEKNLRESEERFRLVAETVDQFFFVRDANSDQYSYLSPAYEKIWGYSCESLYQDPKSWLKTIHPDDLPAVQDALKRQSDGHLIRREYRILRADGAVRWISAEVFSVYDETGMLSRYIGLAADITDRKLAEATLAQEVLQRKTLFNASVDGIVIVDSSGNIIEANTRFSRMLGYTPEETVTLNLREFDVYWACKPPDQEVANTDFCTDTFETKHRRKDGSTYDVEISANRVDWNGQTVQLCICRDISDRKQSENALRNSELRFRTIFAEAPVGMVLLTAQGRIAQVNQAFCQLLDYSESEFQITNIWSVTYFQDIEREQDLFRQLFNRETSHYKLEKRLLKRNGETVWVSLTAGLLQDPNSGEFYKLGMYENITERRLVEQMKDNFVSVVSHELRTPLTSIRGALKLLAIDEFDNLTPDGQELLNIAVIDSQRLVRLVGDILDLERLRSGHLSLVIDQWNVMDIITQSVDSVRSQAEEAHIHLEVAAVPITIDVDGDRVIQTLTNLLHNAIKFSPSNTTVSISTTLMAEANITTQAQQTYLLFCIKDQGRGIPIDKLQIIFEPFEQVDITDARQKRGSGLGLAICQSIVQRHGGRIWATSIPGQGSSFFFTLPVDIDQPS